MQPVIGDDGKVLYVIPSAFDVTSHKQVARTLRVARFATDQVSEVVLQVAANGRIAYANDAACLHSGYTRDQLLGMPVSKLFPSLEGSAWSSLWHGLKQQGGVALEAGLCRANGNFDARRLRLSFFEYDGEACALILSGDGNISAPGADPAEQEFPYDALTSLPGRDLFVSRAGDAVARARARGHGVVVVMIAIDRLSLLKDILGCARCDRLVSIIAGRIADFISEGDTVARVSEDEFALAISCGADAQAEIARISRQLSALLSEQVVLDGQDLFITCSMGIAVSPQDSKDAQQLLLQASMALHKAAARGRGHQVRFKAAAGDTDAEEFLAEMELRSALRYEEFELHYQPRVSTCDGKISGVEALIRWRHPSGNLIMPDSFIPLAEQTDLIVGIGEWVVNEACRQFQVWQRQGLQLERVSVNISPRQFRESGLVGVIDSALRKYGMAPQQLEVELTESMLMEDMDQAIRTMQALKELGVYIALDDFGTGHSCLSHMRRFPFDILKIDKSFVREMVDDANNVAIVEAVIALSHRLCLRVVAEGVEDENQFAILQAGGCHEIQGYLFSRPLPADEIGRLLARGIRLPAAGATG
ncbi:MAG: EAL domain-containing protein [Alcanivoracaceae bacterium]|nr:EAL domain-containing protein [Alcanivoracaceae bacterium]